jgi:signal transduction histidine kinase
MLWAADGVRQTLMTTGHADRKRMGGPLVPDWLVPVERFIRTHPTAVALASIAMVLVIAWLKLHAPGDLSLALSYSIPVAFCGYGVGLAAAVAMSVAVSLLWMVDAAAGFSVGEVPYAFLVRLVMNLGVSAFAALAGAAARERERYFDAERKLERLRADLVSAFSHDLRSPLGAIAGYAELLRADADALPRFDRTAAIDTILTQVQRLDKLIADMLGAAQTESVAPLRISSFGAEALVAELRAELDHAPRNAQMALRWELEPNLPGLRTDRTKLVSIVRNLVNNALKYAQAGPVWVRFGFDAATDMYRIEVEDSGPGISPDALPHLFERFSRATDAQRVDGFGLGLFIVKRFTEFLQGSVEVDSELGRGMRVRVCIPRVLVELPPSTLTAAGE